jgi:DNA-binding NtrC family response regulator
MSGWNEHARSPHKDLRELLDDYERKLILLALDAASGHQRRAAASLGILPSTLSEKMKRLGLRGRRAAQDESLASSEAFPA